MKLKKFDIILKKNSRKPISRIIQYVTKGVYSHSEIYVGDWTIIDAMPNGVKVRLFDSSLGEFDAFRYYRDLTEDEQIKIEEFLQRAINCKYDFVELALQLFHIKRRLNKKYICISLICEAFQYAGLEIGDWQQGFSQIYESKYFQKI